MFSRALNSTAMDVVVREYPATLRRRYNGCSSAEHAGFTSAIRVAAFNQNGCVVCMFSSFFGALGAGQRRVRLVLDGAPVHVQADVLSALRAFVYALDGADRVVAGLSWRRGTYASMSPVHMRRLVPVGLGELFQELRGLRELDLRGWYTGREGAAVLEWLPDGLESLTVEYECVQGNDLFFYLMQMQRLRRLHVIGTPSLGRNVGAVLGAALSGLLTLRALRLDGVHVLGDGYDEFGECLRCLTLLEEFALSRVRLNRRGLFTEPHDDGEASFFGAVARMLRLRSLEIDRCHVTPWGWLSWYEALRGLDRAAARGDAVLRAAASASGSVGYVHLSRLVVRGSQSSKAVGHVLHRMPALSDVSVAYLNPPVENVVYSCSTHAAAVRGALCVFSLPAVRCGLRRLNLSSCSLGSWFFVDFVSVFRGGLSESALEEIFLCHNAFEASFPAVQELLDAADAKDGLRQLCLCGLRGARSCTSGGLVEWVLDADGRRVRVSGGAAGCAACAEHRELRRAWAADAAVDAGWGGGWGGGSSVDGSDGVGDSDVSDVSDFSDSFSDDDDDGDDDGDDDVDDDDDDAAAADGGGGGGGGQGADSDVDGDVWSGGSSGSGPPSDAGDGGAWWSGDE